MITLKYAELHTPLFLNKTNLNLKLDILARSGLSLNYDRENQELIVTFNGATAIVPTANVVSMHPVANQPADPVTPFKPDTRQGKVKAQASSPIDHVHAGLGAGKTND